MNKPVLVVMAAGMGSRYGGMKQIDPVGPCGQVIVDYSLYDARRAGFETVIFVIKHEIEEAFKAAIGDRVSRVMDVKYAFQQLDELPEGYTIPEGRVKPWGTCHAVLAAKPYLHGPFAVINADDYYGPEAFKVIYDYLSTHTDGEVYDYCMVSYLLKNTVSENGSVARGVCALNEDSTLHSVTERTRIETYEGGIHYTEDGGELFCRLRAAGDAEIRLRAGGKQRFCVAVASGKAARSAVCAGEALADGREALVFLDRHHVGRNRQTHAADEADDRNSQNGNQNFIHCISLLNRRTAGRARPRSRRTTAKRLKPKPA